MQKETFLCAFIIALSFLHGCGSSSSDSSPKVEAPKGVWIGTYQDTPGGSSFGCLNLTNFYSSVNICLKPGADIDIKLAFSRRAEYALWPHYKRMQSDKVPAA